MVHLFRSPQGHCGTFPLTDFHRVAEMATRTDAEIRIGPVGPVVNDLAAYLRQAFEIGENPLPGLRRCWPNLTIEFHRDSNRAPETDGAFFSVRDGWVTIA